MIKEVTGIHRIRMLYVQLMYRCNFACQHCFHGELLQAADHWSPDEVHRLLDYFRTTYDLRAVTLLGGEPLLYPHVVRVAHDARRLGLAVEICTNGHYGFRRTIEQLVPHLSKFRVSLEGLEPTNDRIRQPGSFASALRSIALVRQLGVPVGATMTVTALNIDQVVPLARLLEAGGVAELKLHCLRPVGNAVVHPELFVLDDGRYAELHDQIATAGLGIRLLYDADLTPDRDSQSCPNLITTDHLDRIEVDPRGALTVSCKAVGRNASAFRWDAGQHSIVYEPHAADELNLKIPDVIYQSA